MIYDGILEGLMVDLRSVMPEDAEATYRMRSDADKVRYMHKITGTVEDQRRYIENQMKKENDYLFLVTNKAGEPIGMRGIYDVTPEHATSGRTIGYGDAFQNMEALLAGFDFAFDVLGVDYILMDAAAENDSVRGIQRQIGAVEYDRRFLQDLGYEYVYSRLDRQAYAASRARIMKMIDKHAAKLKQRG